MRRSLTRRWVALLGVVGLMAGCGGDEEEGAVPAEEPAAEEAAGEEMTPITQQHRDQIQPGMTYAQVVEIVGREGETMPVEIYEWDSGAVVTFEDGTCTGAIGATGVLGKTYDEVVEEWGAEGERLDIVRYTWDNPGSTGTLSVDFEEGAVRGVSSSMLPPG